MILQAPPAERFADLPASWYLLCAATDLAKGPVERDLCGRRLVAFRTSAGRIAVLDALCSHLGANLAQGCVVGDSIRCPFHGWEYGADGRCTRIPGSCEPIPPFARQIAYPAQERRGFVFVFNGREALFPLPFFFGEQHDDFRAGKPFRFVADCSWYMLAANGFDLEHFRSVHDRTLIGEGHVDCPAPFARRMRYTAEVTGSSIFDKLLRRFVGNVVEVSITSWGGPFILVTGFFRRARSYILIATVPLDSRRTLVDVIVFAPRGRNLLTSLLVPVSLRVRRLFTRGFMQDDMDLLGGIQYNPHTLTDDDRPMIEFFHWLAALPQRDSAVGQDSAPVRFARTGAESCPTSGGKPGLHQGVGS